jgi:hypothetical protein
MLNCDDAISTDALYTYTSPNDHDPQNQMVVHGKRSVQCRVPYSGIRVWGCASSLRPTNKRLCRPHVDSRSSSVQDTSNSRRAPV